MYKALVIAYNYPPMGLSASQRTLKFVKHMKDCNWEPVVITGSGAPGYSYDESLEKEAEACCLRVLRVKEGDRESARQDMPREWIRKFRQKISQSFFIPDNKKAWAKAACQKAREILQAEKFDIIFVSIPPYSVFSEAGQLAEELDIPLFVDYRDLWRDMSSQFYLTPYHRYKHKLLEYRALKAADRVIAANRKIKEFLLTNYPFLTFEDIPIIPHGFDPEDFRNLVPLQKPKDKMVITYSGLFYDFITPKYFLKAFKELSLERPDVVAGIELDFIGHFRKENRRLVSRLKLQEFVKEHGFLSHSESLRRLLYADVLWLMVGYARNSDKIAPGKLYEYFGTRKPVIACVPEGAARTAALEYGASFIAEPDNIGQIKAAILEAYFLYKKKQLPKPNEDFVQRQDTNFQTEELTKKFQFFLRTDI